MSIQLHCSHPLEHSQIPSHVRALGPVDGLLHLSVVVSAAKHRLTMESLQSEIQHHLPAMEKIPFANP